MKSTTALKILLVTGHFPPEISGGVGRGYSLYKYLPEHNVYVTVITRKWNKKVNNEKDVFRYNTSFNWRSSGYKFRFLYKLVSFGIWKFGSIFSDYTWLSAVKKKAAHNINIDEYDLVYCSFPFFEALEIGRWIAYNYEKPLIVEFRDGMCFQSIVKVGKRKMEKVREYEKKIIREADHIISLGNQLSNYIVDTYNAKNISTVRNGFDPEDFVEIVKNKVLNRRCFKVVFFGSLSMSKDRDISYLVDSLFYMKKNNELDSSSFKIDFIGNFNAKDVEIFLNRGLGDIVSFLKPMSKKDGFSKIRNEYDYLLFIGIQGETGLITSKLLEYLMLDKPIIGICEGNEAADIIKETGTGEVFDFTVKSTMSALRKTLKSEIYYNPDETEISKYSRIIQAEKICNIIRDTINE